ncbi:uncharacterized protein LOC133296354 [Gastrolobium bilobum]|uniref:uncharacterized protein LOC133296354 n=1 Tax=Gastrolobium bilobum TaxID=150636 RepID=UPI002AB0876A|nr:uncharacterized protein LOC133296354 [Gastrolobium bilobum]
MEESSTEEEEKVAERTATFYLYHPCYFLEEALRTLFKCLGFEIGSSMVKPISDSEEDPITPENTSSNDQNCSQEVPTITEETAHQEPTTQSFKLTRRDSRRSKLTPGSPPQTN